MTCNYTIQHRLTVKHSTASLIQRLSNTFSRKEKKRKEKKRKEKKRKEKKRKEKKRKEKKRLDYAFRRQFLEKPSIIPGCPATCSVQSSENYRSCWQAYSMLMYQPPADSRQSRMRQCSRHKTCSTLLQYECVCRFMFQANA